METAFNFNSTRRHPRSLGWYKRRWQHRINMAAGYMDTAIDHLETGIARIKAGEQSYGLRTQATRADECLREIDKYQRLIDGRPTREEESETRAREYEARMDAEAHREHSGGWADDEFNAQYDDIRERYAGEIIHDAPEEGGAK